MKKLTCVLLILLLSIVAVSAQDDVPKEDLYDEGFAEIAEEGIYEDIGEVEIKGDAGMTPDNALYFLETLFENMLVGDNPETALEYKEEKILEVKEMINAGNYEAAEKALRRAAKYNEILKKEVTPELDKRVRESSKATKELLESFELEGDEWDEVKESIDENLKTEDKIALAAKVSNKIAQLCKALSDLDPLEYSKVCKTDDDAPKWKRDLDKKLTKEQEGEARAFFNIMSECFQNPSACRCDDISIKPFAEKCNILAPLAVKCEEGDEEACMRMEEIEDPADLLPGYLRDVMEDVEDKYGESKHDLHIPRECVEAGALSREACMKVMFKIHAPPECLEALESGEIDPKNENEAKKACEKIMFESEAPQECIDAGLKDFRECERYMFKLDAPQECLDAGLTGSGRDDWKKCELIRFKLEAPQECLDQGIDGSGRDDWKKCDAIRFRLDAPQECLDAGIDGSKRDDWKKCDAIRFKLEAPQECLDAGIDPMDRRAWDKCKPIQFKLDAPQECIDAGLDGTGRDDWRKCDVIKFKLEAHPDCLAAGLTGRSSNDWRKCQPIQFRAEAPQECLDAGLDGTGRDDWRKCDEIRRELEDVDRGPGCFDCAKECPGASRTDCINDRCECYYDDDKPRDPFEGCGAVDCQQGWHCEYGNCVPDGGEGGSCGDCASECEPVTSSGELLSGTDCVNGQCECYYRTESECKDGCEQECGDQNSDCVDDKCVCLGYGEGGPPPGSGDGGPDSGGDDSGDSGGDSGGDDSGDNGGNSGQ